MGIGHDFIYDFIELKRGHHLDACHAVVEVGAQQLTQSFLADADGLKQLYDAFDMPQPTADHLVKPTQIAHGGLPHQDRDAPLARDFWQSLGFRYAAIDIDGTPGSIPLDLNFDGVPPEHHKQYDLVTNFGTTEHICNQFNAFKVIHDLTRCGGLMMHDVPAQGMINHGLVNYNPKFFWWLARSNGYEILAHRLSLGGVRYPLPQIVRDSLQDGTPQRGAIDAYQMEDVSIKVTIRKRFDVEFVPPLDVPDGMVTEDKTLLERYWTVFQSEALGRLTRDTYEGGALAFAQGDYAGALREWRPHADNGDAKAQSGMGLLYARGLGVSQSDAQAALWIAKSAAGGNADSQMIMSTFYAEGRGVPCDPTASFAWLQRAAEAGHVRAQSVIGMRYAFGDGIERRQEEGLRWLQAAANGGDAEARQAIDLLAAPLGNSAAP